MSSSDDIGFFPQPSPTPTKSANATLICHICQSPHYNTEFFHIFSISVCTKCKKSIKMITKSTCLNEYLLTDYDLKPFKFLIRPNPHKGTWSNMNLYIESEIVKCALEKYGSIENIEKIKNDRIEANLERKKKRMKKKVKDYKRKTLVTMKSERHTHKFVTIGSVKKCDCGLEYEEEEI